MTSQQLRVWPLLSVSPQPSPGDWFAVSVSNCFWPVPSAPVYAACTSLVLYWSNHVGRLA